MKKNSQQSYKVQCRTKTALKTMNQIPIITAQIVESSCRALYFLLLAFAMKFLTTAIGYLRQRVLALRPLNFRTCAKLA